ncbi:MAG: hypothetical protein AAFY60_07935, partial [Myxococcota bacterium]
AEPTYGICDALDARSTTDAPSEEVCAALILSHDPAERIAAVLPRFSKDDPAFWSGVDRLLVDRASRSPATPWLGCAWLYLWEQRLFQFAKTSIDQRGGLGEVLRESLRWGAGAHVLTEHVWAAVTRLVGIWKARDRTQLLKHVDRELAEIAVDALPRLQLRAAALLVQLHRAQVDDAAMLALQGKVLPILHALDDSCRAQLAKWFDLDGASPSRTRDPEPDAESVASALASVRSDELARMRDWLLHRDLGVVNEALRRLESAGAQGRAQVLGAFTHNPRWAERLAEVVMTWGDSDGLEEATRVCAAEALDSPTRFALASALLWAGRTDAWHWVCVALTTDSERDWDLSSSYEDIEKAAGALGISSQEVASALSTSPYSAIYVPAVTRLTHSSPVPRAPLRRFLHCGTERLASLRREAARALHALGDFTGFPILFSEALVDAGRRNASKPPWLLKGAPASVVELTGRCCSIAGHSLVPPQRVLDELDTRGIDRGARERAWTEILHSTTEAAVHERIFSRMRLSQARYDKVQRLAETFAWGVRQGVRLTGRKFSIRMIGGDAFANTRLTSSSININPLPLLRGERDGRTVIEGLILHEFGHHVHHASDASLGIWNRAQRAGLHKLLNLVADEHLERNIRAEREEDGNRLKTLATYAFQRRQSEMPVETLLNVLGFRAFDVLKAAKLEVARDPDCVELKLGETLRALEAQGSS